MKIVFLAPANNYHTKKWCKWFGAKGHDIYVISLTPPDDEIEGEVFYLNSGVKAYETDLKKLRYITTILSVKKIIKKVKPDIINAHYATSYGALAALIGVKNFIVSVWGSDVYDFPRRSVLHEFLLKFVLRKAGGIFSTSKAMAKEVKKYTNKDIFITPFGVDVDLFSPNKRNRQDGEFVIGTVKALSPKYGITTLLQAVAMLKEKHPDIPLQLRIAGKGPYEDLYKREAKELGIDNCTVWLGFISQDEAAYEWANFDCGIIPSESESESFGVSAVEAQACECPVIISDIPGLMEATSPGETSVVFPRGNVSALSNAIYDMYLHPEKRKKIGGQGRNFVKLNYELNECFIKVEKQLNQFLKKNVNEI